MGCTAPSRRSRQEILFKLERFDSELIKILEETRLRVGADNALLSIYSLDYESRVVVASTKPTVTDPQSMDTDKPGWYEIYEYLEDGESYYFLTENLEDGNFKSSLAKGNIEAGVASPVYDTSTNQLVGYVAFSWTKGAKPYESTATLYSEKSAVEVNRLIQFI